MTLILNESDWNELHEQMPQPDDLVLDEFEEVWRMPDCLGQGLGRSMNLLPGMWLLLAQSEYYQDVIVKTPAHDHPIQISIFPSGAIYFDEVHPNLGNGRSYFSGSGVSPAVTGMRRAGEQLTCVDIEIEPELMHSILLREPFDAEVLQQLFQGEDWKISFYPTVTTQMRSIVQQMWDMPYRGAVKRMYLQAKVMELLVIYLDWIAQSQGRSRGGGLKRETIAALHQAKEILERRLENPPAILELAEQVGISDRTLLRGFKQLFGTTAIGYCTQQRLKRAEQLLRQGDRTVADVARLLGYEHLGYFASAFKRQFGILPSECLAGKKSDL
jgi:AraC-like DNA-binding protein